MANRFITTEQTRLPLTDGDYLDIKTRLSHGDREDANARVLENRSLARSAVLLVYLLGWSFTDEHGQPVPYHPGLSEDERLSAIRNLTAEDFDEAYEAIDKHKTAQDKARAALKKTKVTKPELKVIGESRSAVG
jgi:hypothetical protein